MPVTSVHILYTDVLHFLEKHGVRIETTLSDNGREFCGRPDKHPYELLLQLAEIERRTTIVHWPQSNGFVVKLHQTLLNEHFVVMGRKKWYESLEEIQTDLDEYLPTYNTTRPDQGYGMNGWTPC